VYSIKARALTSDNYHVNHSVNYHCEETTGFSFSVIYYKETYPFDSVHWSICSQCPDDSFLPRAKEHPDRMIHFPRRACRLQLFTAWPFLRATLTTGSDGLSFHAYLPLFHLTQVSPQPYLTLRPKHPPIAPSHALAVRVVPAPQSRSTDCRNHSINLFRGASADQNLCLLLFFRWARNTNQLEQCACLSRTQSSLEISFLRTARGLVASSSITQRPLPHSASRCLLPSSSSWYLVSRRSCG
jgi:hypothetical protein